MSNNPFRKKPSINVQQKVEDWGKTKFRPKVFKSGDKHQEDLHNKNAFNKKHYDQRSKNKDNVRYNEVAKGAKPENSTPWNKYKDEIIFKQRDEQQTALQANIESDAAKTILKQREINYRRSLVERKKKEPTKWEDFADDDSQGQSVSVATKRKGNQSKKIQFNAENSLNAQSKTNFKKNQSKPVLKKEFISNELLQNFDSKKLSFEQNDKLRAVITRTTIMASQSSLENVVKELKKKKNKQAKKI